MDMAILGRRFAALILAERQRSLRSLSVLAVVLLSSSTLFAASIWDRRSNSSNNSESQPQQAERLNEAAAKPAPSAEDAANKPDSKGEEGVAVIEDKNKKAEADVQKEDKEKKPEKKTDAAAKKSTPASPVSLLGDPLAQGKIKLMQQEIVAAVKKRGNEDDFSRFLRYTGRKLDSTAGPYTGSELTGNCRLSWYDHLLRNPISAPAEAEIFTRELHRNAMGDVAGFERILVTAEKKMDIVDRKPRDFKEVDTPQEALETIKKSLADAQVAYAAALAPLTKTQLNELQQYAASTFLGNNVVGHTLNERGEGRRLCDLMDAMDRKSLFAAADALAPLASKQLLEKLKELPVDEGKSKRLTFPGVTGEIVDRIDTPAGTIIIGGKGPNTYQLDAMPGVCCVIDLGGKDTYIDGVVGPTRPLLVTMDLSGNDLYRSAKPGVQGGALLGVSMLLDLEGDDVYQAQDLAQASAIAGVGILIDYAGNDHYVAVRRAQGHALCGLGILIDKSGTDDYHAAMWAQGFGAPMGFGLLDDVKGNDHYYCGGMWRDSYPETPGMEGWGQGVGAGIRQVADGGIGVILDGAGDDVYEFDYLSHGGGYWCGCGFARDFAGNDQRLITRKAYNGGQRTEPLFQRFGCGWGCHYSIGFCIDDSGNDLYEGTIMGTGMAWDCSTGMLLEFGGNDHYASTGGLTQGTSNQMGFGVLFDYNGDDQYDGYGQGYATSNQTYHPMPDCGGNFAFVIDYGGKDTYGCGAENNVFLQRGTSGGFLIDRPRQDEIQQTAKAQTQVQNATE